MVGKFAQAKPKNYHSGSLLRLASSSRGIPVDFLGFVFPRFRFPPFSNRELGQLPILVLFSIRDSGLRAGTFASVFAWGLERGIVCARFVFWLSLAELRFYSFDEGVRRMGKRPSLRVILFWTMKPVYGVLIFTIAMALIFLLDTFMLVWKGLFVSNFELVKLALLVAWALAIVPGFLWNGIKWAATDYTMTERQFIFSKGVISRKKYVVNYEQVQNINVDRGPVELVLGVRTVRIETAGAKPGESELEVEGVSAGEAEKLVRGITQMADVAKSGRAGNVQVNVSAAPSQPGNDREMERLKEDVKMLSIELKEVKDLLAAEKRKKD
jgi:membrane protein YdbS with pleckstrin-like domain